MGSPDIMYLSKSQVRTMWPNLDTKHLKLDEFSAKASLSINPSAELGGKWSAKKATPSDEFWPPWDASEVVKCIDRYVSKHARVGVWSDVFDNAEKFDFFSLGGKLKFADTEGSGEELMHGRFKAQSIDAVFCGELPTDRLAVSLSLQNIPGINRHGDQWEVWESGADWMLHTMSREGFDSHGLLMLTNKRQRPPKSARVIYLTVDYQNS